MADKIKEISTKDRINKETAERRAYIRQNIRDFSPEGAVFILIGGKLPIIHLEGWYFTTTRAAKRHVRRFCGKEDHLKIEICRRICVIS